MKKILALILSLALSLTCILALASCDCEHVDENGDKVCDKCSEPYAAEVDGLEETMACYENSMPTKVVTNSVQSFYEFVDGEKIVAYELLSETTLVTGKVEGLDATVETTTRDILRAITNDKEKLPVIQQTDPVVVEYLEGYGRRTDGGAWDEELPNHAPTLGSIAINITKMNIKNASYTQNGGLNELKFAISKDDVAEIFGNAVGKIETDTDISVTIINDGAVVTGVKISYGIEAYDNFPERLVELEVAYDYSVQVVNISK